MAIIFFQLPQHSPLPSRHVVSHETSAVLELLLSNDQRLLLGGCFGIFFFFFAICLKQFDHGVFVFQAH